MIAYLDCSSGVSGDKFLGALIDAGFDPGILRYALDALGLESVQLDVTQRSSRGVTGVGVAVTEPGAPRRHWRELRELLSHPQMPEPVRSATLRALQALAEAEAAVHGVPLDEVHFHEIGAADTIADTLGVALGMMELGITRLVCSPVAVGSGTVKTAHGTLPVPAPATVRLLEGVALVSGPAEGELTTPTGAALLAAHASAFGTIPEMTLRRVGVGCGTRDIGVANVCTLLLGEELLAEAGREDVAVLESNIDHLTAEELAEGAERLRAAGALDVWQTPIVMKKGRAATMLSALAPASAATSLASRMIAETGTLGVRVLPASRRLVERDVAEIPTSLGTARFKVSHLPDKRVLRVEADDAARLAADHGMPVDAAARRLETEASRATGIQPMRQPAPDDETNPSA